MKKFTKNLFLLSLISLFSSSVFSQIVRMETVLGNIDIEMHPGSAPNTVTNFMDYVNAGDYDNSFIHRSVSNFIIQGGGFKFTDSQSSAIESNGTVDNEYSLSNLRGTIAMAKVGDQPDSATSQWFFNVVNNLSLNTQNGGFTVFGTVIDGMDVVDAINNLDKDNINISLNGASTLFADVPYLNTRPSILQEDDAVIIYRAYEIFPFKINPALSGAWYYPDTSGSGILLEVYPESGTVFMAWFTYDTITPTEDTVVDIGDAGHRWFTGFGSIDYDTNTVSVALKSTSGGLFDSSQEVTNTTVGTVTITFEDCSQANVEYNFVGQNLSSSFPIQRLLSDNIALCQRLSSEP